MKIKILLSVILFYVSVSYAQQTAALKGTVTFKGDGKPAAKIKLTLLQDSDTLKTLFTDSKGYYAFEGLAAGIYSIQIGNSTAHIRWIPEVVLCEGEEKILDFVYLRIWIESKPTPKPGREVSPDFDASVAVEDVMSKTTPLEVVEMVYEKPVFKADETTTGSKISQNEPAPQARLLTSGEVNDFAKWNQWDTILEKHFKTYWQEWNFKPQQRYIVQVTNKKGIPIVNATVTLKDLCGQTHWTAQTDNTGKAELWLHAFSSDNTPANCRIEWQYQGKSGALASAVEFAQGINCITIAADCETLSKADLFFVLDATGSMGDEMRYLQVELQDIIGRINKLQKKLSLRIGSLVYRDEGDEYLTRKQSLDIDLNKTVNFLKAQAAGGGGDYPEAVDEALYQTVAREAWNPNAVARIVFIILDAPAHTEKALRLAQQIKLAAEKGIRIVPIACSDIKKDGEYLMRCLALATNGTYLFLTDDSGIGNSHIKPTTDKYEVEKLNDAIARIVRQYTQMPDCRGRKWIERDTVFTESDKFVPNPYDEEPALADSLNIRARDLIKVYPNPCQALLYVEIKQPVHDLYLVDMSGKAIMSYHAQNAEKMELDMQKLSAGIYFIKVFYKGKWYSEKVVKVY
ncbi:MAG: carboxypeptidase regulatory-like domain-containing protein [Bacteroidales bacterium]|jgi:hypothetical protein|nr:carboxypeptidase regulatory-like domain-containing protein [Bacteroidales bacterium]